MYVVLCEAVPYVSEDVGQEGQRETERERERETVRRMWI
jgi:hypothetical protein